MLRPTHLSIVAFWTLSAALFGLAGETPSGVDEAVGRPAAPMSKPDLKAPPPDPLLPSKPDLETPPPAPLLPGKPEPQPAPQRTLRDPTKPGPTLRTLVAKPGASPVAMPLVELKGRILADPRTPMVTLAIGSQLHMVAEGTKISLPAGEILVSRVTAQEVQLQILPMQQVITLH